MLPNEVFALACRAYYEEQGLVVDKTNGQFAHSPLTRKECDTGYYLIWGHHQHQGLLQSKDLNKCCFFSGDAKKWLLECDYFPENYFELWDIYEKYSSDQRKAIHAERDELGRSVLGIKNSERINAEKDEKGRSVNALKGVLRQKELGIGICALTYDQLRRNAEKIHIEKDEEGKSKHAVKCGKAAHRQKNDLGKSVNAVKTAENTNSQVWESTIDGFRSNPGNVARHNIRNGWDPHDRVKVQ
jgi:hypothetical protein